ncbi:MAG: DoxX family protein [Burkholderiales bacterium]|nr:DoxX family protein [Burkholderiales bacterium]
MTQTLQPNETQHRRHKKISRHILATFFIVGGALHFVFPTTYIGVMPPWLPWRRELVLISGAFEMAGGLGVLPASTRRLAGLGLIALSIVVWPANLQMLLDANGAQKALWWQALLLLRLPLQLALIYWIWRETQNTDAD